MDISLDYRNLFRILNKHRVKYLVVGAYAVIYYTEPRYTKDMDVWVKTEGKNADKVYNALKEFGAPLKGVSSDTFSNGNMVYQMGVEPIRIDIIMGLKDADFNETWKKRVKSKYGDIPINIIGLKELIDIKKSADRDHDRLDLKRLMAKSTKKK